jgi:hypothetical protein
MNDPKRPLNAIIPVAPAADRRPTVVRPSSRVRDQLFRGWGPSI